MILKIRIFLVATFHLLLSSEAIGENVYSTGGFPKEFLEEIVESVRFQLTH